MAIIKYKISVVLLLVQFLAFENAENLAKVLRSQYIVHDPSTIQNVSCWAKPFNRSVSVVNISATLIQVINDAFVRFQLYKRTEVIFKPFLPNITEDYCAFMISKSKSKYLQMLTAIYMPYTNLNHTCPYFGYVYIKDLPLDGNHNIPALWPVGDYRLDIVILEQRKKILTIEFYFEIKEKRRHWRM